MKRYVGILLTSLVLFGCSATQKTEVKEQKDPAVELKQTSIQNSKAINEDTCYKYQRSLLHENLQDDYDRLYGALLHHESSVLLDCSMPYVMKLFDAVTFDHPELFWSNYEYNYKESDDKESVTLYPSYAYDQEETAKLQKQVDAVAAKILQEAEAKQTDYERVKLLYDWIIDRSDYVNKEENNQNMLSVFLDKKAVCAGYSKSFKYLLDQLHIPNAIILVQVIENPEEYHVINMVQMDKQWYYLDPTFGDIKIEKSYNNYRYAYFAMTSEEVENIYVPQQEIKQTAAYKDSFFYQRDAYLKGYDENQIIAIIASNINNPDPCLAIKCDSIQTYEQVKQLLRSQHVFDLFQSAGYNPQEFEYYSLDENYCFFLNYW